MKNWIRNKIIEILIDGDSRDIEIFGGLQVLISGFFMSVSGLTHFPVLMWLSFIVGAWQVSAAIGMSIKARHITNFLLALVCAWVALAKATMYEINYFAVLEYGYIAMTAGYCTFKTKMEILKDRS